MKGNRGSSDHQYSVALEQEMGFDVETARPWLAPPHSAVSDRFIQCLLDNSISHPVSTPHSRTVPFVKSLTLSLSESLSLAISVSLSLSFSLSHSVSLSNHLPPAAT